MSLINPNYKPRSNARCKNCGSKKVYWSKYFDEQGSQKFILNEIIRDEPHWKTCEKENRENDVVYSRKIG